MSTILQKINFDEIEFLMFVLDELAENLEAEGKDVIRLTLGKVQEELHPDIVEAHVNAIKDPSKRNLVYPEGLPQLRQKIAQWYTNLGNQTSQNEVLINTGTSPFFKDLFRYLLDEDSEILIPGPYYSVYYISAILTGAKVKFYDINPETMSIDMDSFKANYDKEKTKVVVFCSPGNPYGNIVTLDEYNQVLDMISKDTYILSDEIYRNTGFYEKVPSILDLDKKRDQIIISNSFSKGFRMYTARVGFCILPTELLKPFRVMLQHTLLTTNPTEQFAAIEALNHLDEVETLTELFKERNEYTVNAFKENNNVKVLKAEGGFYLVIDCNQFLQKNNDINNSFELAKDILKKTGVAVVPGSDFGLPTGLRISFTNKRYNEAIDRIANYFNT